MQVRYNEYRSPLISYTENNRLLGIFTPGRYRGYDTLVSTGVLTFTIEHNQTGVPQWDVDGNPIGRVGVSYTRQGVIVQETEPIGPFTVDTNVGNSQTRYDFLVMTHEYVPTPGGDSATYSIIKGPLENPVFPTLTQPDKQIIIGIIELKAGDTVVTSSLYFKGRTPDSGDEPDARLNETNHFNRFLSTSTATQAGPNFDTGFTGENLMTLPSNGNLFPLTGIGGLYLDGIRINETALNEGARLVIRLDNSIGLTGGRVLSSGANNLGYKPFLIPITFADDNGNVTPPTGNIYKLVEILFTDNKLFVTNISSTGLVGEDNKVSASSGDARPATLIDKIVETDFIKKSVYTNPDTGGTQVQLKIGNSESSFDNVWHNMNLDSIPSGWNPVGISTTPGYKIDFFGTAFLRGTFRYSTNIASGASISSVLTTVSAIKQAETIKFPIAIDYTAVGAIDSSPYCYLSIDASGNVTFHLENVGDNSQTLTTVTIYLKGIVIPN